MKFKALLAVAAMTMAPAVASANTVNPTNWGGCIGNTTCTVNGIQITGFAGPSSNPSNLAEQDFRGLRGLGVGPGASGTGPDNEIQALENESIVMDFTGLGSGGIALRSIQLGHFYNTEDFSSDPEEKSIIDVLFADGDTTQVRLQTVTSIPEIFTFNDTAGFGLTVTKDNSFQGLFTLSDLFGGKAVSKLTFSAVLINPDAPDDSDYSIASVTAVPLPAAGWMLLAGLGGLFGLRRFRKTA